MTSGLKTVGSFDSSYFFEKSWSGADGAHVGISPTPWHPYGVIISEFSNTKGETSWLPDQRLFAGETPWTDNDDLALLAKLAAAVKGHEFNLGVALGQGRQTADLVVSTVVRFTQSVRALKRGRIDQALRYLGAPPKKNVRMLYNPRTLTDKDVSAMWLEIQYGYIPLIMDVHASCAAFAALTDKMRTSRFIVKHSASGSNSAEYMNSGFVAGVNRQTYRKSVYLRAELTELPSPARSLGLQDPASIVWELVPFSFVVDWFIPIGTYFEVLSQIPNLSGRFLTSWKTTVKTDFTGQEFFHPVGGWKRNFEGASSTGVWIESGRSSATTLPVPRPKFKSIGDALSVGRIKNAVALLHQLVR